MLRALLLLLLLALLLVSAPVEAAGLPPIVADARNAVPACVTPARLMQFVAERNAAHRPARSIDPRFTDIASSYQRIGGCVARPPGQCVGVRWDYAFFQMLIETGYLTFHRPDGTPASIVPMDNNFAGVGAAISGKPGERFKDVETGVLAHLQHVLMYSTTPIPEPVAQRTRLVQNDVQDSMRRLRRPVTFDDLARIWTGSGHARYAATMRSLAERYAQRFCAPQTVADVKPPPTRSR
ncbi:MAG: N-acetylmuramoyl-L-alanine amidase [Pseudolabrys sp.]